MALSYPPLIPGQPTGTLPTLGTNFSDGIRMGNITSPSYNFGKRGAYAPPYDIFSFIPAASVANNVALSQTPSQAGYMTLAAGTGVTLVQHKSSQLQTTIPSYQLDCARNLIFTSSSAGSAVNYTIWGYDYWGIDQVETITRGIGATATSTNKTYRGVYRIYASAAASEALTVGTGNVFGLRFRLRYPQYAMINWGTNPASGLAISGTATLTAGQALVTAPGVATDSVIMVTRGDINASTAVGELSAEPGPGAINITSVTLAAPGTPVAGDVSTVYWQVMQGINTVITADGTDPATATTGDTRGKIVLTGTPPNGARILSVNYYLYALDQQAELIDNQVYDLEDLYGVTPYWTPFI